ncbi:MAG: hypothetical protein J6Y62_01820 [Clostridia bacterium]|nr:hypothetical protein [Clostridia bacterium]
MSFTIHVSKILPVGGRRYGYQVERLCRRLGAYCEVVNDDPEYLDGTDDPELLGKYGFRYCMRTPDPDLTLARIGVDLGGHAPWGWNDDNTAWTFCSKGPKEEYDRARDEYINVGWEHGYERKGTPEVEKHNREVSLKCDKLYEKVEATVFEVPEKNVVWRNVWTDAILEKDIKGCNAHPCTAFYDDHPKMYVYRVFHPSTFKDHLDKYFSYDQKERETLEKTLLPLFEEGKAYLCYSW